MFFAHILSISLHKYAAQIGIFEKKMLLLKNPVKMWERGRGLLLKLNKACHMSGAEFTHSLVLHLVFAPNLSKLYTHIRARVKLYEKLRNAIILK